MSNKLSAWEIMRCESITVVSVTYGTGGQLQQNVISGPKLSFNCLPEEGLYILYRNRGLQIASACDRRKCYTTQVCCCTEQRHVHANMKSTAETRSENKSMQDIINQYWKGCVVARIHLHQAAEEIRSCRLCFLAHPRTLSWDNIFDNLTFHFDDELEEHYASIHSYGCPAHNSLSVDRGAKDCPPGVLEVIYDAWRDFLDSGDYRVKPGMIQVARGSAKNNENDNNHTTDRDMDDISEWDDTDTPIHVHSNDHTSTSLLNQHRDISTPDDDFDFDLIDDLIEEEFPQLKKTLQRTRPTKGGVRQNCISHRKFVPSSHKVKSSSNSNNGLKKANSINEGLPAPVITPPKNMLVGLGIMGCNNAYGRLGDPMVAMDRCVVLPC
ncbi:hypothetical protein F5Y12DRAFT_719388 [Xylaria sp. FL1777]|nr:hypothetical protein F5Y12DRAFT_719388 [Xylaria sp. FL1777]